MFFSFGAAKTFTENPVHLKSQRGARWVGLTPFSSADIQCSAQFSHSLLLHRTFRFAIFSLIVSNTKVVNFNYSTLRSVRDSILKPILQFIHNQNSSHFSQSQITIFVLVCFGFKRPYHFDSFLCVSRNEHFTVKRIE